MTRFISMTDLMRSHVESYQRLAWFLYEAAEREHHLNLKALAGTPGAFVLAWARMSAPMPLRHEKNASGDGSA